jgi:hypothetical protein
LWKKEFSAKDIHKEMFDVNSGSQLFEKCGICFDVDVEVEMEVHKWPRRQSKDFYAASFDALVKQWDKCINVSGGYVEK